MKENNKSDSKNSLNNFTHKNKNLTSKVKNKMNNYLMTNFNFILDRKKDRAIDDINNIPPPPITIIEYNKKIPDSSTSEIDKNKEQLCVENDNNTEKFIYISEDDYTEIDNNNDISSQCFSLFNTKENIKQINSDCINFFPNNSPITLNENEEKIDLFDDTSSKKINQIILLNEEEKENNSIITFLGKKTNNSIALNDTADVGTQTYEFENDILPNKKEIMQPKLIILELIEKYSYKFIFNLFIKYYANKTTILPEKYDKELVFQIQKLIKDLGFEKVMRIILSIDNLNNEEIKVKENNYPSNNNIINLDEEEEENNTKKENVNNLIIDINEDSKEEISLDESNSIKQSYDNDEINHELLKLISVNDLKDDINLNNVK